MDGKAVSSWLYPTNMPVRDYQFNIVQKALFHNTLVSIPTGMGKTLIAAVVMVNYYRWFPEGKIIFMAPTRPLAAQQQEACTKVTGIPYDDQISFFGTSVPPAKRGEYWVNKRVFFCTPQIVEKDLKSGVCPGSAIVCLVVDEAHKATGNYAYSVVVRELVSMKATFRVLALSATPGSRREAVQEVVSNLRINRIEIRTEDSFDLRRYTFQRQIDTLVVPMSGAADQIRRQFVDVARPMVMRLKDAKLIYQDSLEFLTPFMVHSVRGKLRDSGMNHFYGDVAALHKMALMYESLVLHSVREFYQEVQGLPDWLRGPNAKPPKPLVQWTMSQGYRDFVASLRKMVIEDRDFVSHPKLVELEKLVLMHFTDAAEALGAKAADESKVIVFAKYRSTVEEINQLLSKHSPLVRPTTFVGQGKAKSGEKGLNQREQLAVLQRFQRGGYNVLVSTSVGEEGLDIGEVDLIVCYDSSQSPIQMLQRMGRTGRKRAGRVVLLLAQGREEGNYRKSQSSYKNIQSFINKGHA
ncbi:P-loop containing nucleoside triphosphate hydrolase protein, partial [Catenaria anguillulae PL171]